MPMKCRLLGWSALIVMALPLAGQIRGPMLGWVWDSRQESIRPVLGITGSSVLGKGIDLGAPVRHASISGSQEFAVYLAGENRSAMLVDLRSVDTPSRALEGIADGAIQTVLSPRGEAALFLYEDPKMIRVVRGLPAEPVLVREIDLSVEGLPVDPDDEAHPLRWAVSDDGTLVALGYPGQKQVLLIDESSNRVALPQELTAKSISFLEKSSSVLIAAGDGVYLVQGAPANLEFRKVWETTASAATALEGGRILLVDPAIESVVEVNADDGSLRVAQCPCSPTAIVRMSGSGVFRLNEVSADPLWLLEIQKSGLRTVFVPPDAETPQ